MTSPANNIIIKRWFEAVKRGDSNTVKTLLDAGFDPSTVNDKGYPSLCVAIVEGDIHSFDIIIPLIVNALKKQYADDPKSLLLSLEKPGWLGFSALEWLEKKKYDVDTMEDIRAETKKYLTEEITAAAARTIGQEQEIHLTSAERHISTEPRSSNPPPLKPDRSLTLSRLQEKKADGRTNLQIFAEQGQLADVFTTVIWQGRKDEMDKAWQLVKPEHQKQVDIELVRQQIDAFSLRDRFRRDDDDLSQGF